MRLKKILASVLSACMLVTASGVTTFASDIISFSNAESVDDVIETDKTKAFEYVYIDEEVVNIPQEQNIAIAFADTNIVLKNATLYCKAVDTQKMYEMPAENIVDNTVLFQKQYTDISEVGTYELYSVIYQIEGMDETITVEFSEQDVNAFYKVTDEPEEQTDSEGVLESQKSDSAEVAVYSLNDIGNTIEETAQNSSDVDLAVEAVLEQVDDGKIEEQAARTKKENLVVVICPGHDATHTGATGYGLKEEELTFKIATYCKEELEKYAGVTVYMSRDTIQCSYPGENTSYCLNQRVTDAYNMGADVFVDVHINAGGGTGAEVYYPNNSYSNAIHMEGKELAEQIASQLEALGLKNRGAKTKDCTDNIKDDDGKLADYYSSIAGSKEYGMVGLIIEHAFIDNKNDVEKMKDESFLKKMGIADATGIAKAYGLVKGTNVNPGTSVTLPFTDVNKAAWYYDVVEYIYSKGIMTGLDKTTFGPDTMLSRAHFATVLYRMEGEPVMTYANKYPDVSNGIWYTDPIMWANQAKVITGYENGMFGVADEITREQIVLILYRYAGYKGYDNSQRSDISTFSDSRNVSGFAKEAMQWAIAQKIITGKDNGKSIDPQGSASRAECGAMIMRFNNAYGL